MPKLVTARREYAVRAPTACAWDQAKRVSVAWASSPSQLFLNLLPRLLGLVLDSGGSHAQIPVVDNGSELVTQVPGNVNPGTRYLQADI